MGCISAKAVVIEALPQGIDLQNGEVTLKIEPNIMKFANWLIEEESEVQNNLDGGALGRPITAQALMMNYQQAE